MSAAAGLVQIPAGACGHKYEALTRELQATFADDLKTGQQTLDRSQKRLLHWLAQEPSFHQLDLSESRMTLAERVTIGTNSSGWTAPPPASPVSSTSTTTSSAST